MMTARRFQALTQKDLIKTKDETHEALERGEKAFNLLNWLNRNAKIPLTPSRDFYAEDKIQEIQELLQS